MKRTIIAAGTLCLDTLETPYDKRENIMGGCGNYFSLAASLFTNVELSSIIGVDFPKEYLKTLNSRGIGTSNIAHSATGKTYRWCAKYSGAMNEAVALDTPLNILVDYDPVMNDVAKKCEILFLANLLPVKQLKAIEGAAGAKLRICDTMACWVNDEEKVVDLKKVMKKIDIFVLNEHEARALAKEVNIIAALNKIVQMGPKTVIIKRGEYGSLLYREGEKLFAIPAYPVNKVVDPTGAGDTFAGGFVGYLATSPDYNDYNELKKAMLYGTVTASFTVQGFGTEALMDVSMDDVQRRYNEMVSIIKVN